MPTSATETYERPGEAPHNSLGPDTKKTITHAGTAVTETITETITPIITQLKNLGFKVDDFYEEYINKLDKDIINKVRELVTRGIFAPQANPDEEITVEQLKNIQNKFGILSYLHKKRLKMSPEILGTIEDIETDDIYDLQVKNFVKYKIEVTDAKNLTKEVRGNTFRPRIEIFYDLGYPITERLIRDLRYGPYLHINNLSKLVQTLKRPVSLEVIQDPEHDDGLNGCNNMDYFNWYLVGYLTENDISIPDKCLVLFNKKKGKVNKENFQPLIKQGIKILKDNNTFYMINDGEISKREFKKIYGWNHSNTESEEYETYIDEHYPEPLSIEDFITAYQKNRKTL